MNGRLETDKQHWESEATKSTEEKQRTVDELKSLLVGLQDGMAAKLFETPGAEVIDTVSLCPLKDLRCYVGLIQSEHQEFRWPEKVELRMPSKLTEILTGGSDCLDWI